MKQSIRLTLYFKFIAFRDLTSVRAGATPQRMFEKRKRHGETDVKVLPWSQWFFLIFWAFIVHCNAPINSNGAHRVHSSPNAHATSGSRHRRSQVTLTVTLACLLVLRSFPRIFEEKRDCSQSRLRYARAPTNRLGPPHTSRQGPTRRFEI